MATELSAWFEKDLEDLARSTREWAADRIEPLAVEVDRSQAFSPQLWSELGGIGVFGLAMPAEFGGAGATALEYVVVLEQIAYASGVAALYPGTTMQVAQAMIRHGSPAAAERWAHRLVAGEAPGAWAFTEPGTGSDPRQLTTRAERDRSGWVLRGQKAFISYAAQALVALVFAQTDDGVTAFLVDTEDPGWQVGAKVDVMSFGGTGASTVFLDEIRVAADHVVGEVGHGFKVMLNGEAFGKVRVSAINVGVAQRALDVAAQFARERLHRGVSIGERFSSIQSLLADMQAQVFAARALLYDVAQGIDLGRDLAPATAALRLTTGRAAREVASSALQICGAYGLTSEMPVERLYREAKFFEVAQGSAEIQRVILGKSVLGSPPR